MSIEGLGHLLQYIFQVLYVLYFTRPRYQVSVYRTIGPLVVQGFQFALVQIVNVAFLPVSWDTST